MIGEPPSFRVLFVCTANQCRSPLAEHLLRTSLSRMGVSWVVGSAGVRARDGAPMHPHAAAVLSERSIPHADWTTQRLTPALIAAADLVLTAEIGHRHTVVTAHPAAVRYCFTLRQFSLLLSLSEVNRADGITSLSTGPELIQRAELARSRPQAREGRLLEIADPIGKSISVFRATAELIDEALVVLRRNARQSTQTTGAGSQSTTRGSLAGRPRPR